MANFAYSTLDFFHFRELAPDRGPVGTTRRRDDAVRNAPQISVRLVYRRRQYREGRAHRARSLVGQEI